MSNSESTLEQFRSFASMLRQSDPTIVILSFLTSKQHYSSLHSIKQIQEVEENSMLQYFKPYYQKKKFSLSGFFHINSTLTLDEIKSLPSVEEWLDTNKYHICQCPSQSEEMVPIGVICYSSPFHHREELKQAILYHPTWQPNDKSNPPVFDVYLGDFLAGGKKTKMLFISAERSRQEELTSYGQAGQKGPNV
jgi:hypothetical protein